MDASADTAFVITQVRADEAALPAAQRLFDGRYAALFRAASDAHDDALRGSLARAGFRIGARTLFVLKGVVPYLTDAAVDRTLGFMARASGVHGRAVLDDHVARFPTEVLARRIAAAGFRAFEDTGMDALHRARFGHEPPAVAASFRMMTACAAA